MQPTLIIHGGASTAFKDLEKHARVKNKIGSILNSAYLKLFETNAIEAVVYAVQLFENDPDFNAGTGSSLQKDGKARLSASIMDGIAGKFAGVINIENIKNPILVAKALLKDDCRVLASDGAFQYAMKLGLKSEDPRTPEAIEKWKKKTEQSFDTVGACALDKDGNLASATSTGGRGDETPGRVSDSCMPAGNFASSKCAISATGVGEEIIDEGLAVKIATRVQDGLDLKSAFQKTFEEVRTKKKSFGAIGVDFKGNIIWDTTTDILTYGWKNLKSFEISP